MEQTFIASFIVRFHLREVDKETNKKDYRIKVTYVQNGEETLFETMEEAVLFMKTLVGDMEG